MGDETVEWVERWAGRVESLNLSPEVLSFLDLISAFGALGSQILLIAQPLLTGMMSETTIRQAATFMSSPDLQSELKNHLEGEGR